MGHECEFAVDCGELSLLNIARSTGLVHVSYFTSLPADSSDKNYKAGKKTHLTHS